MAIDWGRVAMGVGTGYLGAKIANTEANDAMNANIIERAGLNFYETTLPNFQENEKNRKSTYTKVSIRYGKDVAEYMDQGGFTDYNEIVTLLGSNDGLNETRLKAYLEATSAGTYGERAEERVTGIQDREKTIMGLTSGSSKIGNMTADLLIDGGKEIRTDRTVTTPAVEASQVGPVITEAVPEKTEPVDLPSFEEIFGDTSGETNVYLNMDGKDQKRYKDLALKIFAMDKETLTGDFAVAEGYEDDYKKGIEDGTISNKTTRNQYIFDRWFKEQFLPNEGVSYNESGATKSEPLAVTKARNAINYNKSIGNDVRVNEARGILKSLGYEPADYGL